MNDREEAVKLTSSTPFMAPIGERQQTIGRIWLMKHHRKIHMTEVLFELIPSPIIPS